MFDTRETTPATTSPATTPDEPPSVRWLGYAIWRLLANGKVDDCPPLGSALALLERTRPTVHRFLLKCAAIGRRPTEDPLASNSTARKWDGYWTAAFDLLASILRENGGWRSVEAASDRLQAELDLERAKKAAELEADEAADLDKGWGWGG